MPKRYGPEYRGASPFAQSKHPSPAAIARRHQASVHELKASGHNPQHVHGCQRLSVKLRTMGVLSNDRDSLPEHQ